jgi:hypothetical protein
MSSWWILFAIVAAALWIVQTVKTLLDKAATWQRDKVAAMLESIDQKNHERYADVLQKLSVLRRQNEVLARWANLRDAIAHHEREGRQETADSLRKKSAIADGCDWIEDWTSSVEPWLAS